MHNKPLFAILAFCLLALPGCEPEFDGYVTFTTPRGEHYSVPRGSESLQHSRLVFDAIFDESAIYDFGDLALQTNKNKLLGFSDCFSGHHDNSARFAWQWFNGRLEIYAYCYVSGAREEAFVGTVDIGAANRFEIQLAPDAYVFHLNDFPPVRIRRSSSCTFGHYYMLWPYFGGSLPAPHDVHIKIKRSY